MSNETIESRYIRRMVRVGKVTVLDEAEHMARVYFEDLGVVSQFMKVLQHSSEPSWMPKIDDLVVCLYQPMFNADGYILGVIP